MRWKRRARSMARPARTGWTSTHASFLTKIVWKCDTGVEAAICSAVQAARTFETKRRVHNWLWPSP